MNDGAKRIAHEIISGNYHKGGLKISRLYKLDPSYFDFLRRECLWIHQNLPSSDVTKKEHVTNWTNPKGSVTQQSLFNRSGKSDDTGSDFTRNDGDKFAVAPAGSLSKLIARLAPAGLINMRLNYVGPDSKLSPHEEHNVHNDHNRAIIRVRFHIPITTNDDCRALLDNEYFLFQNGFIFFFNNGCVHASENRGKEGRLHLVFDMLYTEKCYDLMFNSGLEGDLFKADTHPVVKIGEEQIKEYAQYNSEIEETKARELIAFA